VPRDGRERGADAAANQHPYTAGSTNLSALLPSWILANDPDEIKERLRDHDVRRRIREDIEQWGVNGWENLAGLTGWDNVTIANVKTAANSSTEGRSLAAIAPRRDVHPAEVICDLLIEEDFEVDILLHKLAEGDVHSLLSDERISICTDGFFGENPHPRTYGTYPKILGELVRDRDLLSLEEAIRKMTSLPARMHGLFDRGLIRPGMAADVVVFDPLTVDTTATYEQPARPPRGIYHVIVNGDFVVRDEKVTGALPGVTLGS
jgi:N-acyl-D-amino-acid deacylase